MKKILALIIAISYALCFAYYAHKISTYKIDTTTKTEAIVVLTGGKNRIKDGVELAKNNMAPILFVSGVEKGIDIQDLNNRKDIAIPSTLNIELGHLATTTKENAYEVEDWIIKNKITSIRLVTSFYHMPRAVIEIQDRNKTIKIIENPIYSDNITQTWWQNFSSLWFIFKEFNKYLYVLIGSLL